MHTAKQRILALALCLLLAMALVVPGPVEAHAAELYSVDSGMFGDRIAFAGME